MKPWKIFVTQAPTCKHASLYKEAARSLRSRTKGESTPILQMKNLKPEVTELGARLWLQTRKLMPLYQQEGERGQSSLEWVAEERRFFPLQALKIIPFSLSSRSSIVRDSL